jgi:hypothetical protein
MNEPNPVLTQFRFGHRPSQGLDGALQRVSMDLHRAEGADGTRHGVVIVRGDP